MKKLDSEFGSYGQETNKAIPENLNLPAIEYYKAPEVVASPLEVKQVNEDSSSSNEGANAESEALSRTQKMNEANEQLDRVNNARNTADGLKSPDINATEAVADGSSAAIETAAEAGAASASVTSTVATLAGPVSVIAAAAVGIAAVTGGVLQKEPDIISEYYEVGTNYIKYELDVDALSDDMEYIIRVSNPTFNKEFKIESAGMQRQIVTGLKPYRNYDVEIIGISKEIGEIPYYKHTCGTNQLPMPKAVFQFEPHFDYVLGKIDLDYEAFISDFYNAGGNEYLQIYVGNKLLVDNHNLPDDHFFRGTIRNINQINDITAVAYSDYYDGKDLYEGIEIGRYGYNIDLPKDFSFDTSYKAIYTFDDSCFYNEFDFEAGNTLTVNTNFTNDEDPDELYRIDVYNAGDLDINPNAEPINSIVSNEKEVNLGLNSYTKYVDVKFTQLKRKGEDLVEYESSLLKYIEIDPKIMSEEEFRISPFGYFYNMYINEEYTGYGDVDVKFTKNYKDGTSVTDERFEGETVSIEGNYDDNKGISDLESIDLEIKYNNILIENTRIYNNVSLTLGSFDIDDDGNILIPYEINIPANAKVEGMWAYINFAEMDEDYTDQKGTLVLKSISSNVISGSVAISYNINGRVITKEIDIDEFNLGADVSVSYYAPHYSSFYDVLNIKFDTTIDGKNVNINPNVYVYDGDVEDYVSFENRPHPDDFLEYMDYYTVNCSGNSLKYKFTANGFSDEVHTISINTGINSKTDFESVSAGYLANDTPYVTYVKTTNSDGTVNYNFNTMFNSTTGKHFGRIEYDYIEDGIKKYGYTDFSTDSNIKLENIKDLDYTFRYQLYYLEDGIYYCVDPQILVDDNIVKRDEIYYECHGLVNSINVEVIDDETVLIEALGDDFSEYKLNAVYYAKESEDSSYTKFIETGEIGVNTVSFSKMAGVRSVTVNILKEENGSDVIYATYEIVFDVNVSDYIYNEGDDSIALPYELLIPNSATIGEETYLNDEQITSRTGNYVITELDSNTVVLNFNISYKDSGCVINYSFSKTVILEGETVLIEDINSFLGNSSYGSFSLQRCYIDENGTPYYSDGNGEYRDESGNLKPDNAVWGERVNTIYTYSGSVVNKIGCFNIPYDKEYVIQVKTSGVNLLNSETGNVNSSFNGRPDVAVDGYSTSSNNKSGIYLTFLHTVLSEYFDGVDKVIGQSKCELEFDILVDGKVLFTKKIEFTEPGENSTLNENSFEYDSSSNETSRNSDGTVNLTINTGFDSTLNPNYVYKLQLYEKIDYNYYDNQGLVYESDYLDTNIVNIYNVKDTSYEVKIAAYYVENGNYVNVGTYAVGNANSALTTDWDFDYDTTTYTNILMLDKNYINKDYLDGTKQLEIDLNGGSGGIDLSNTTSQQTIGFDTIEVTDSDGIITVRISATSNSDRVRGNVTLSQGNEEIGYTDITYSI